MKTRTLLHHLLKAKKINSSNKAVKFKNKNTWVSLSWPELYNQFEVVASGLKDLGLNAGDKVAILVQTRLEWELIDIASLSCSAITVPIYQTYGPEDIIHILNDSGSKVLFCENREQFNKWLQIRDQCPTVKRVVIIDCDDDYKEDFLRWNELVESGKIFLLKNKNHFSNSCKSLSLNDVATIIYTSGTTGTPKGVVLTHKQIMSELTDLFSVFEVNEKDCTLTFLPFAHVVGRVEMWGHIYKGYTLAYAENIEKIKKNLLEVRPTLIIAVPRIFEKIYNGIQSQIEVNSKKEKIFNWALAVGHSISQKKIQRRAIPIHLIAQQKIAKKLVFDKILEKLGGRLRFAISGGAPLSEQVSDFFHAMGLLVLEGYGLSETTAAICINNPLEYNFGSVGKPLGDVKIKIAEDGEILVKSAKVMKEYYNLPEETSLCFTDGYFHTGDIGEFTREGFLRITDRKKDLIKTSGGKYVAPQKLENLIKLSPLISNVLIHGDEKKYIVALLTLDEEAIKKWALSENISFNNYYSLIKTERTKSLIRDVIADVNSQLSSHESIKTFDILEKDFSIENGELTPSLKVKRKFCDQVYRDRIERLYGTDRSSL